MNTNDNETFENTEIDYQFELIEWLRSCGGRATLDTLYPMEFYDRPECLICAESLDPNEIMIRVGQELTPALSNLFNRELIEIRLIPDANAPNGVICFSFEHCDIYPANVEIVLTDHA